MSKETTIKTQLPKLRFPEFMDMGKWEENILGCVSDVRDGTHDSPKFYRTGRLLITSKNLLPNGELDLVNANLISEQDYKQINKRSKVDIGDIIFGMIGTIGNPVRVRTEGYAIKNVALIKQKKELLNSYLVQFLNSEYIAREFSILNSGNSQKFISLGKIRSLSFPTPPITEQQKIADCLSSIDDLITAQAKNLELLNDHKKGLMQQLFPAEGETVPKLRFSEFRGAPEWGKKSLGEIAVFCKGKGLPKSAITHEGRNLCIHYGELFTKYTEVINTVKSRTDLNDGCLFSAENDVLMPTSDVTPNGLAKACCIKSKGVILGGDILVIRPDRQTVNGEFLARLIRNLEQKVLQLVSGSTVFHLYASSIDKLALLIPVHIEQQKIADCLSSIDELISAQIKKLETLKAHKKGLMQQLFPVYN
ncbi:hypothetical protein BMR06_15870 [Methylococcaceae bacterium HT5]|nr:hypothetical protein BMR06_15870 [Methylococcaceae bacterium HT5]